MSGTLPAAVTVYWIKLKFGHASDPPSRYVDVTGSERVATRTNGNPSTFAIRAKTSSDANL